MRSIIFWVGALSLICLFDMTAWATRPSVFPTGCGPYTQGTGEHCGASSVFDPKIKEGPKNIKLQLAAPYAKPKTALTLSMDASQAALTRRDYSINPKLDVSHLIPHGSKSKSPVPGTLAVAMVINPLGSGKPSPVTQLKGNWIKAAVGVVPPSTP